MNTLASAVTNIAACRRLYGSSGKTKRVNGIVRRFIVNRPTSGRTSTTLEATWTLSETRSKIVALKLNRIKSGTVQETESQPTAQPPSQLESNATGESLLLSGTVEMQSHINSHQPESVTVHGITWTREEILSHIQGPIQVTICSIEMNDGNRIVEGGGSANYTTLDFSNHFFQCKLSVTLCLGHRENLNFLVSRQQQKQK